MAKRNMEMLFVRGDGVILVRISLSGGTNSIIISVGFASAAILDSRVL